MNDGIGGVTRNTQDPHFWIKRCKLISVTSWGAIRGRCYRLYDVRPARKKRQRRFRIKHVQRIESRMQDLLTRLGEGG
jgi:hypothetical protein